jgi:hypothetical protein
MMVAFVVFIEEGQITDQNKVCRFAMII